MSFASENCHTVKGFDAFPRWFLRSKWFTSLPAAHRAVLITLYDKIARLPVPAEKMGDIGIPVARGQWAMSVEFWAKASGASVAQVRLASGKAIEAGVISVKAVAYRTPTMTNHISLITWLDFDSYDRTDSADSKSPSKSHSNSPSKSHSNSPSNNNTHNGNTQNGNTHNSDPEEKTQKRENTGEGPSGPSLSQVPCGAGNVKAEEVKDTPIPTAPTILDTQVPDDPNSSALYEQDEQEYDESLPVASARDDIPSLGDFYQNEVDDWRRAHRLPALRLNRKKLATYIAKLLDDNPRIDAFQYIETLVTHWDLVKHRIGQAGAAMILNETHLSHGLVVGQVLRIIGEPARDVEMDEWALA